ncbi:MAG: hypothetical protein AAGI66_00545 [Cyanobacteria bacterium P01_H01_bin.74]
MIKKITVFNFFVKRCPTFFVVVFLLAYFIFASPLASAWWFKKESNKENTEPTIETYQPPPEGSIETRCEPIRQKAVIMNEKPLWRRWAYMPYHVVLVKRHRHCVQTVMEEETLYLRHIDTEQVPSLPEID